MFLIYLLVAFISGAFASGIAAEKHRSGCLFFGLGFIIGPLAVLAAAMLGRDESAAVEHKLESGELVECPACKSPIHPQATICPFCRTTVIPPDAPPSMAEQFGRFLNGNK
jgi:hypothetical protein